MKDVAEDSILLGSFYKNCGNYLPRTNEKIRQVLAIVAGTWINPKVKPDDFIDVIVWDIKQNINNPSKRDELILDALRTYKKASS